MKTQKQIEAMSLEERRIATAEIRGWTFITPHMLDGIPPNALFGASEARKIPNYPADLNAAHDLEFDTFHEGNAWSEYYAALSEVCNDGEDGECNSPMSASAVQRNVAFLMVTLP